MVLTKDPWVIGQGDGLSLGDRKLHRDTNSSQLHPSPRKNSSHSC